MNGGANFQAVGFTVRQCGQRHIDAVRAAVTGQLEVIALRFAALSFNDERIGCARGRV